jgi:hypothetical protein
MLPMLIEMPNGRDGAKILSWAVRFTILVTPQIILFLTHAHTQTVLAPSDIAATKP